MMEMHTNEFEEAFSEFLDRREYDEAENYLFSMIRLSFAAGWQAAGGAPPKSERLFELIPTHESVKTTVENPVDVDKNPAESQ